MRERLIGGEEDSSVAYERGIGPVEVETLAVDIGGNRTGFAEDARRRRVVPQTSAAVLLRQFHVARRRMREHPARVHHRSGARIDIQTCQPHFSGNFLQSRDHLVVLLRRNIPAEIAQSFI